MFITDRAVDVWASKFKPLKLDDQLRRATVEVPIHLLPKLVQKHRTPKDVSIKATNGGVMFRIRKE